MRYLVLDVGGSSIKYAIMDEEAHIYERSSLPTPMDTLENFVETIGKIYNQYQNIIEGIAISMPGILNPKTGYCYTGGALQYIKEMNMIDILQKRCCCPITIGNDAKCAAQAELGFGNLQNVEDAIVILLGTGIGGCLIKDGKVHYGKHFIGGEFSFVHIDSRRLWCQSNGSQGLLENVQKRLETTQDYTGYEIFEMAQQGNGKVQEGIKDFIRDLLYQIYNLQTIFDPEKFVIGGGISAQPLLFKYIEEINQEFSKQTLHLIKPCIESCQYHNDSNLIGALYQYLNS